MKKKIMTIMLAGACICSGALSNTNTVNAVEQNTTFIMGDVNDDGEFNVADIVLFQKYLLAVPDVELKNWRAADLCQDDRLDVFDMIMMKRTLINIETVQSIPPITQSIGLNNTEELITLLNDYNLNDYNMVYRDSLSKMFNYFDRDGYVYHFTDSENEITLRDVRPNSAICLMPYAKYEDAGILYHVEYKGKYFQIYYYFTDPSCHASDLWDYLKNQRMGYKNIRLIDDKIGIVDSSNDTQFDMCAFYKIDDAHYCKVKTYESEEALMDLLQILEYEKLDIADNTTIEPIAPITAQPIRYKDIETAIEAISSCDVSAYPKMYQEGYSMMFKRFKNDGFIYQVKDNALITTQEESGTVLFPNARYEDVGIGYYVTFKDKTYHITFYTAKEDLLAETDGIVSYLQKRMGCRSDKEIMVNEHSICLMFSDNGQCYANSFVDENHYFDVIGSVSEAELTEFLKAFEYSKTVF